MRSEEALDNRSVSVVIATRDRPELLRRAIRSIREQDHDAIVEVIVVFDRSEPDLSLVNDDVRRPVRVIRNDHSPGLPGARNAGIAVASQPWFAFCDDDDEWLPGKLHAQFDALEQLPGSVVATTGCFIHYDGQDTPRIAEPDRVNFDGFLRDRMQAVHPSATLVWSGAWDDIGPVDEEIPGGYAEDYDWMLRAARLGPFAVVPEPKIRAYWHGASYFFERWKMIDQGLEYLVNKFPEFHRDPVGLARIRGQQAVAQAAMGERRRAWGTIKETFRLSKTERRLPVAVAVSAGIPAAWVLKLAHRFGKGI